MRLCQAKREKIKQQKLVKKQNQMKLATMDLEFKVVSSIVGNNKDNNKDDSDNNKKNNDQEAKPAGPGIRGSVASRKQQRQQT